MRYFDGIINKTTFASMHELLEEMGKKEMKFCDDMQDKISAYLLKVSQRANGSPSNITYDENTASFVLKDVNGFVYKLTREQIERILYSPNLDKSVEMKQFQYFTPSGQIDINYLDADDLENQLKNIIKGTLKKFGLPTEDDIINTSTKQINSSHEKVKYDEDYSTVKIDYENGDEEMVKPLFPITDAKAKPHTKDREDDMFRDSNRPPKPIKDPMIKIINGGINIGTIDFDLPTAPSERVRNRPTKTPTKSFNPTIVADLEVKPMISTTEAFVPPSVADGKDALPAQAQAEIPKLLAKLRKSNDMLDYGSEVSVKISTYADRMLEHVALANVDEFAKPLTEVLTLCAKVNSSALTGGDSKIPFLKKIKDMFASQKVRAMAQFNTVKGQIDDIVKAVDVKEGSFKKLIVMLEDLYVLNMNDYYMLEAHIRAAETYKKEQEEAYDRFMLNNAEAMKTNPFLGQQANDIQRNVLKTDRKLHDLRVIQLSCVQFAPQIRREQDTTSRLIEKFAAIKTMAIPLWKKQCAAYISSIENKTGIALANKADATTNTLYRGHMDTVNKNATESARALETGTISMDTLEYANQSLIASIEDVLGIVKEGTKARADAIPQIANMKQAIYTNVIAKQNEHVPTEKFTPKTTNEWNTAAIAMVENSNVISLNGRGKMTTKQRVKPLEMSSAFDTDSFNDGDN